MNRSIATVPLVAALLAAVVPVSLRAATPPNIVIILTDDQGYADVSYNPHHSPEVSTPHIDALAKQSVICSQGYVTGHVCSPTRAGLMTGRYQQRFGIYTAGEGGSGVPLGETFLPQLLGPAGYATGAFGKWHMGLTPAYNATKRGFDSFYGFMGRGAHDYFDLRQEDHPIYRGLQPIDDEGYLTHRITEEAVAFIRKHAKQPFFAYIAYNAVHAPAQAPPEDIRQLTGDDRRDTLMAMLKHLDDGVGAIVQELESNEVFDNTLLFFLTDNGGAKVMKADNAPLRGFKQQDYEGGIRVPFIVSWPESLRGGTRCDVPVVSFDIFPTALAAAGIDAPADRPLDGKNMLPALRGEQKVLHERLFWSSAGRKGHWAVREGRWKLVAVKASRQLFDIEADPGETKELSSSHPDVVARLSKLYDSWLAEMGDPASGQPKRWSREFSSPLKKSFRPKAGASARSQRR